MHMIEKKSTLENLAGLEHTYWRFSQSQKGRSIEKFYAEYKPGKITVAENEKKLSFVNETTIANCFMYGDMLTKLVFDIRNEEFKKIMNCKVKCIGDAMGEYECCKLLPEKNYSLSDVNTIRLIFSMVKEKKQLISIFFHGYGNLESRLRGYGFLEAADLVHYLNEEFNKDNDILLKRGVELIDTYLSIN